MKTAFYPKLAWEGIRKNRRMVFPYILTCICMISMFYILAFLSSAKTAALLPRGGGTASQILTLGGFVIAVFSMIFLYYTNSFLIRRRAGEFGLYNVLGMDKGNIIRIITLESLMTSAISIFFGLLAGIVLSKLAELGLIRMIGGTVTYDLRVDMGNVKFTVLIYLAIFAVIWLSSIIRVSRSTAVSLLNSEKTGEKAPKANWLHGILGAVILFAAYYIAVSIENPIEALLWFFLAVLMVIIATYLLMIAGSVLLCRILQRNKTYYYDPRHFISVSSMVYRMKRNGAGLASIAIIATMVLVMISSASCMWFGTKNMLQNLYPGDVNLTVRFYDRELLSEENLDLFRKIVDDFATGSGSDTGIVLDLSFAETTGSGRKNTVDLEYNEDTLAVNSLREVFLIPLSVYNEQAGQNAVLRAGEALAFTSGCTIGSDTLDLILKDRIRSYRLVNSGEEAFYANKYTRDVVPQINLVIPDLSDAAAALEEAQEGDMRVFSYIWKCSIDVRQSSMSKTEYADKLTEMILRTMGDDPENAGYYSIITEERETESMKFISSNGSLFFIGVVLSVVFLFAAVLIIYYKQISEGYEDSRRFEVMRKVGMTGEEIKRNINSQLLVVFFIPLAFAGVHLAFAFPMIGKLLTLFGMYNRSLFIWTTLISYVVFAIFYASVYKVTSNIYYRIVSDAQ